MVLGRSLRFRMEGKVMTLSETQWTLQNRQAEETRQLRKNAWFVGLSLLAIFATQVVAGLCLGGLLNRAEAQMDISDAARLYYYALYCGYYCLMLLVPTAVMALIFRRSPRSHAERPRLTGGSGVLLIAFGLAFCVLANYLVNYWLQFVSLFGVEPYEGDYHNAAGWLPLALNLFTYAILPGLVEETVFRGWILGALRPFGERRALLLSALIFGLMHGNLTQVPFAFLLGMLFGFLYLRTGRLWIGMVIHALNNALSVVLDYVSENMGLTENTYILVQLSVFAVLVIIGCTAAFILRHRDDALTYPLRDHRHVVPTAKRARMMWLSPAIVAALVLMLALTVMQEMVL